jgi:hypothetical protein
MEWFLPIGTLKRFGHRGVAILYKSQLAGLQILHAGKTGRLGQFPHHNIALHLNTVHPRRVFRDCVEHGLMRGIGQTCMGDKFSMRPFQKSASLPKIRNLPMPSRITNCLIFYVLIILNAPKELTGSVGSFGTL